MYVIRCELSGAGMCSAISLALVEVAMQVNSFVK